MFQSCTGYRVARSFLFAPRRTILFSGNSFALYFLPASHPLVSDRYPLTHLHL